MNLKHWLLPPLLLMGLPAQAQPLLQPSELSDLELAQLRGRYVLPDRIINFGVTMNTLWQNGAGQGIGAQVSLQVQANLQPQLSVTFIDQAGSGGTPQVPNGQIVGGAGLGQVQGVVQSVRTAGDYNRGSNQIALEVHKNQAAPVNGGTPIPAGTQSFSNAAGSMLVQSNNRGLQLQLNAGALGSASQHIGQGGISQHANILGTQNRVQNLTTLSVGLRDRIATGDLAANCFTAYNLSRPIGY
ncbi:MAG: hypothetical protein ACRCTL_06070 [Pseudomonas sp.]